MKKDERSKNLGPGDYKTDLPSMKPDYMNNQPNFVFREGMKDRFGDFYDPSREKKPIPGPDKVVKKIIILIVCD